MSARMLIDAAHAEETRVVVSKGNRIEEFDFESAQRKQLKGNIYLAKVTRVEPSLQAAFVDYGGNRHGFLAFSEIHPDYYQIPLADREALLREQEEDARRDADDDVPSGNGQFEAQDEPADNGDPAPPAETGNGDFAAPLHGLPADTGGPVEMVEEDDEGQKVESVGAEDALEEVPRRMRRAPRRTYKIQEVIKRRQVILIQVVKEERGTKGAALTTYLSLAGRYCVLMPNTARGGGISRKITDAGDRRRLKEVARDIEVPDGMGLIVRTAGAQRTKLEIKRDYDYLLRLWESVRDLTLQSTAPALVYEEGSLIKRAIRDLYTKDVEEVIVEGEDGYREAKDFMKMLMPSHARNVKLYKETRPLFSRHQVDSQLDSLFSPIVNLPSGGTMVMNQTEALVAIDINSGKSTREHNIEDTALKTNCEAAEEIARQLRLRDMAGLIVIDYIDMEEKRNNRTVERKLKEALKNDRARIQVGRISHFGLLEMSRQRLRPGLLEGTTRMCPHCEGRGIVRSTASCALSVLRAIEDHLLAKKAENLTVTCAREVATYILNEKRDHLLAIEAAYGISIFIQPSDTVRASAAQIDRAGERAVAIRKAPVAAPVKPESAFKDDDEAPPEAEEQETAELEAEASEARPRGADDGEPRKRRGRRGGRRSRERNGGKPPADGIAGLGDQPDLTLESDEDSARSDDDAEADRAPSADDERAPGDERGGRRRGRRGRRDRNGRPRGGEPRPASDSPTPRRSEPIPVHTPDEPAAVEPMIAEALPEPRHAPQPAAIEAPPAPAPEEPRRWTPPAPTQAERPAQPRGGWWNRRT